MFPSRRLAPFVLAAALAFPACGPEHGPTRSAQRAAGWRSCAPALSATAEYLGESGGGQLALLSCDGVPVDSVDLAFGVHRVGRDSLLFLPVKADPPLPGLPPTADITRHVLWAGGRREVLRDRLPWFDDFFSSPHVVGTTVYYWGLRPVDAAGGYVLYAARYDLRARRVDTLRLGLAVLATDERFHLPPPVRHDSVVVYYGDAAMWRVDAGFARVERLALLAPAVVMDGDPSARRGAGVRP